MSMMIRRDTSQNTLRERMYLYDYDKVPAEPANISAEAKARGKCRREIEARLEERELKAVMSDGWD